MRKILISLDKRIALILVLILIAINLIFFLLIKPSISHSNENNSHDTKTQEILFRQDGDTYIDENHIQTEDTYDLDEKNDENKTIIDTSADQDTTQDQPDIDRIEEDTSSEETEEDVNEDEPPPKPDPFEE